MKVEPSRFMNDQICFVCKASNSRKATIGWSLIAGGKASSVSLRWSCKATRGYAWCRNDVGGWIDESESDLSDPGGKPYVFQPSGHNSWHWVMEIPMSRTSFVHIGKKSTEINETGYMLELRQTSCDTIRSLRALVDLSDLRSTTGWWIW